MQEEKRSLLAAQSSAAALRARVDAAQAALDAAERDRASVAAEGEAHRQRLAAELTALDTARERIRIEVTPLPPHLFL